MKKTVLILSALTVLLLGCNLSVSTSDSDPVVAGGTLNLQLSAAAPWLSPFLERGIQSRGYLYATRVRVYIYDSNDDLVIPMVTLETETSNTSGNTTGSVGTIILPTGTGYYATVYVYNDNSSTYSSQVSGTSDTFDILDGQTTTIDIYCTPGNPNSYTVNTSRSIALDAQEEYWYTFTAETGIEYTLNQLTADVPTFLFASDGTYVGTATSAAPYVFTATGNDTYYIGVAALTESVTSNILVEAVLPPENEGSIATPIILSLDTSHEYQIGASSTSEDSSFYTFTTTDEGSYYIELESGFYGHYYLYSDSIFSTQVLSETNENDVVLENLSATTQYYLRLQNTQNSNIDVMGTLYSPLAVAAAAENEGAPGAAIPLTFGTPHSGSVGNHIFDHASYYSFTTGTEKDIYDIDISFSNISSEGQICFTYNTTGNYTSGYRDRSSSDFANQYVLLPDTTYYVIVKPYSSGYETANTYDITVSDIDINFTALTVDGSYVTGIIDNTTSAVWFEVSVTEEMIYDVYLDDSDGSGSYSFDGVISAYHADRTTSYFTGRDDAYNSPGTVTIAPGETTMYLKVYAYSTFSITTGNFGVRVTSPSQGSLNVNIH